MANRNPSVFACGEPTPLQGVAFSQENDGGVEFLFCKQVHYLPQKG